ncbi:uncharacterized protein LOC122063958 isoform X2 [Macadamia integrifolia]|uniref:uncharacterized protein LOC122063958 isoform X2 n=1 Tax=Macadamia integrifolia TaxID=60698 RepID=UPI001C4E400C|nr:uncharacterized protein LOC122063958 isoform X2 [Macadamia integrifolia]XP_042483581.1 uncharacterized protein LOC122063958 isoform X2 [Macadamia integrifolia]XP_042483582.1 uncharacterized protein LOC122063958 isoform X2 [Macadamia integrifolia]
MLIRWWISSLITVRTSRASLFSVKLWSLATFLFGSKKLMGSALLHHSQGGSSVVGKTKRLKNLVRGNHFQVLFGKYILRCGVGVLLTDENHVKAAMKVLQDETISLSGRFYSFDMPVSLWTK